MLSVQNALVAVLVKENAQYLQLVKVTVNSSSMQNYVSIVVPALLSVQSKHQTKRKELTSRKN